MKDFDTIKWGFIFSAIGIALGWFLSQLSQWWRVRQEDKKTLKQVLFNLLEIHNIFSRYDVEKPTEIISEKILKEISNEQATQESKQQIQQILLNLYKPFVNEQMYQEIQNIEEKYQSAISELSKIDPLAAYYLSGKTSILDKLELIEDWFTEYMETFAAAEQGTDKKINLMDLLKPNIMDEAITDTEKQIISIAWKINPVVWWNTKNVIAKNKRMSNNEWEKKIDRFYDDLKSKITAK